MSTTFSVLCFVLAIGGVIGRYHEKNCSLNSGEDTLSCYSCMGRDMDNCMTGVTCCSGSCFKLVDVEHDLILKGCVDSEEEDASMKVRELGVELYWANDETVKGESYFCNGNAFCNVAPSISMSALTSVGVVLLLKLIA